MRNMFIKIAISGDLHQRCTLQGKMFFAVIVNFFNGDISRSTWLHAKYMNVSCGDYIFYTIGLILGDIFILVLTFVN